MTVQNLIGSQRVELTLDFHASAMADSNGTMDVGDGTITEYVMNSRGSVIGFGVVANGTFTTGTITFTPTLNGNLMNDSSGNSPFAGSGGTIGGGAAIRGIRRVNADKIGMNFNEGDRIGLMWNKAGTVAPTTRNTQAYVIVMLDKYDY